MGWGNNNKSAPEKQQGCSGCKRSKPCKRCSQCEYLSCQVLRGTEIWSKKGAVQFCQCRTTMTVLPKGLGRGGYCKKCDACSACGAITGIASS
jgi:hypothetical protein